MWAVVAFLASLQPPSPSGLVPGALAGFAQGDPGMRVDGATLRQYVEDVQRATKRRIAFDDAVAAQLAQKKLHLLASDMPRTVEEHFGMFQTVLKANRLALVPSGDLYTIVAVAEAQAPFRDGPPAAADEYVTRLFRLEHVSARDAHNALVMLARGVAAVGIESTGAIVITDFDTNLRKYEQLLRAMDRPKPDLIFKRVALKRASAPDVERTVNGLLQALLSRPARGGQPVVPGVPGQEPVRIASDARTNSVIVFAEPARLAQLVELIGELDVEAESPVGLQRRKLRHASAEEVAKTLTAVYGSDKPPASADVVAPRIVADPATNSIIVTADRLTTERVLRLAEALDERRAQVHIVAAVVEVRSTDTFDLGVELARLVDPEDRVTGVGASLHGLSALQRVGNAFELAPSASPGLTLALVNDRIGNIGFLLRALEQKGLVRVADMPEACALDNGSTTMSGTTEVPFPRTTFTGPNATPVRDFEFVKAETTLTISPHISEGGYLRLETNVRVQKFLPPPSPDAPPGKASREITAKAVLVPDGRTAVIGGIVAEDESESVSKVPLLGDLPLVGRRQQGFQMSRHVRSQE